MTPLERAARALFEYEPGQYGDCVEWAIEQDFGWRSYVEQVKLVLAAIREPDEAMVKAGGEQVLDTEVGAGQYESIADGRGSKLMADQQATNAWTAMIDAILVGGE
jgi:hypothetical protein